MHSKSIKLVVTLLSSAALWAGCSSASAPAAGGSGGHSGGTGAGTGGSTGTGVGVALTPDATGYIDVATNSLGIMGAWYAYGDGVGSDGLASSGDCQKAGHPDTACSKITMPAPGSFANTGGKMCTSGTVAMVVGMVSMPASPDYSKIWGAGIGVDLNHMGITPKGVFNATAKGATGFSFDLDMKPLAGLRVEAQTVATDGTEAGNDYWGATSGYPPSPVMVGTNTVKWSDIVGPKGHVFDPTMLEGLQFHVPTTTTAGGPYSFCISNLKMLM